MVKKCSKRKLTKHKKLFNNTIIEIDSCSPLEILGFQKNLTRIAQKEQIKCVYKIGKRKLEIQQLPAQKVVESIRFLRHNQNSIVLQTIFDCGGSYGYA